LRNKKLQDISTHDLQQWTGSLVSPTGKGIERKTVNRKVSAIITYFLFSNYLYFITVPFATFNCFATFRIDTLQPLAVVEAISLTYGIV
jgi:hypothetical protein